MKRFRASLTWGIAALIATSAAGAQRVDVRGSIRDSATRQPLNGALLTITDGTNHYTARTDEAGEFFIYGVHSSGYRAVVRRIGYAPLEQAIEVVDGMKALSIAMSPLPQTLREVRVRGEGAGIFGQIGNASTLGIVPGARIEIAGADKGVVTDSNGTYFVSLKRAGSYVVRVSAEGFAEEMYIVNVKKNQVADGSRLITLGEGRHVPEVVWKDFDQRMRWSTVNGNALLTGSEVRSARGIDSRRSADVGRLCGQVSAARPKCLCLSEWPAGAGIRDRCHPPGRSNRGRGLRRRPEPIRAIPGGRLAARRHVQRDRPAAEWERRLAGDLDEVGVQ
jgi:hypothetical protein